MRIFFLQKEVLLDLSFKSFQKKLSYFLFIEEYVYFINA